MIWHRLGLRRALPRARARRGAVHLSSRARPIVGALLGAVVVGGTASGWRALPGAVLGLYAGAHIARALGERARKAEVAEARAALPLVLDRLATCVLAGMSVERALRTVAPGTPGVLGEALTDGLRALDLGVPRARVYERIADRAGPAELRAVLTGMARAERFGTSVADALVAHADDLRARARAAAEAEARTAPVKLLFPLVLCFLPAFVLLTIAPIALSAIQTLSGI